MARAAGVLGVPGQDVAAPFFWVSRGAVLHHFRSRINPARELSEEQVSKGGPWVPQPFPDSPAQPWGAPIGAASYTLCLG